VRGQRQVVLRGEVQPVAHLAGLALGARDRAAPPRQRAPVRPHLGLPPRHDPRHDRSVRAIRSGPVGRANSATLPRSGSTAPRGTACADASGMADRAGTPVGRVVRGRGASTGVTAGGGSGTNVSNGAGSSGQRVRPAGGSAESGLDTSITSGGKIRHAPRRAPYDGARRQSGRSAAGAISGVTSTTQGGECLSPNCGGPRPPGWAGPSGRACGARRSGGGTDDGWTSPRSPPGRRAAGAPSRRPHAPHAYSQRSATPLTCRARPCAIRPRRPRPCLPPTPRSARSGASCRPRFACVRPPARLPSS
jgi:hypothetical protein